MAREYPVRRPVQSPPVHPGEILREDVLPALRLSMTVAAKTPRNDWRRFCTGIGRVIDSP